MDERKNLVFLIILIIFCVFAKIFLILALCILFLLILCPQIFVIIGDTVYFICLLLAYLVGEHILPRHFSLLKYSIIVGAVTLYILLLFILCPQIFFIAVLCVVILRTDWKEIQRPSEIHLPSATRHSPAHSHSVIRTVCNSESQYGRSTVRTDVFTRFTPDAWSSMQTNDALKFVPVSTYQEEFREISKLFKSTTKKHFKISKIQRVQNPFLWGSYLLKKEEMTKRYAEIGVRVKEMRLFHGTREAYLQNICTNNFDWRQCGSSVGHIFGKGVSFSPLAYYASHYTDKNSSSENVMLLCKVIVGVETVGRRKMNLPPVYESACRYDTAINREKTVYVKFSDSEFYPEYVIYYTSYDARLNNSSVRSSGKSSGVNEVGGYYF